MRPTLAILAAAAAPALAADVYNNTFTRIGTVNALLPAGAANSSVERGNRVTLAGAERDLSSVYILARILGTGVAQMDARLRLYANDGPIGGPGTLLWDSGDRHFILDSGGDLPFTFIVPGVHVPNTFTWTIHISNRSGFNQDVVGLPHYTPPTIGSSENGYWQRPVGGGPWTFAGDNEPPFGAHIWAVACYANCDESTLAPVLNVQDFSCFLNRFADNDGFANCDGSTTPPTLNIQDFSCFLNRFAAGCS